MHRVVFSIFAFLALVAPAFSEAAVHPFCDRLLRDETLRAAIYKIDIGSGHDEPEMGEVIVIRDSDPKPEREDSYYDRDNPRPEMEIPGEKPREIPRDIPFEEPALQIITPTPEKKKYEIPIVIIPDNGKLPDLSKLPPLKKPNKPLPN